MQAIENLILYLEYPFVRYALLVSVLVALCASLFGASLVLKRFSFIGDGLSHVAFGAVAVAAVLGLTDNMLVVAPITIAAAVLLLKTGVNSKIKGDAAIAMLSVGALAFGYLLMNIFSTSSNLAGDVCTTLFGSVSVLTLTEHDVALTVTLSIFVVITFVLFYNRIFAVTFDEDFAQATGTQAGRYNLFMAIIIAMVIVVGMRLVGALLISALVVFPALSAMRLFGNFKAVVICSALISVTCAIIGTLGSILAGTPVGASIVAVNVLVFAASYAAGALLKRA